MRLAPSADLRCRAVERFGLDPREGPCAADMASQAVCAAVGAVVGAAVGAAMGAAVGAAVGAASVSSRSAVGQQSVRCSALACRPPVANRGGAGHGRRGRALLPSCTLPAVTLPAPWPRLSCLCAFMVEPSRARVSVISFVCQDSKFLSGLSSFCQDSQVCLSGLSSLRQDCPIRTIPQRARTVERGAGRLSFTAGGEGKEGCSEGRWRSRRRHL